MGIDGTTGGFLMNIFNKIGEAGIVIDTGKEKENGTSKNINPLDQSKNRNGGSKDRWNMDGDLTSRNMNSGKGSNKDNPRVGNLKVNNEESLRLNNHRSNSINHRVGSTHGLKENLKERVGNIDGVESIERAENIENRMKRS